MDNYEFIELCKDGTPEEIQAAINSGADPNARSNYGRSALTAVCNCNTSEAVRVLLKAGANPNATEFEGWTSLMSVVDKDDVELETVRLLLEAGADVNAKNDYGTTPLLRNVCWNNRPDIVTLLLEAGADMYACGAIGFDNLEYGTETPVEASIGKMDNAVLKIFLDAGADINKRYSNGQTLLIKAAGMYHGADCVKFLLEAGADVNIRSDDGLTALIAAIASYASPDTARTVNMLLEAGADPNIAYHSLYALDYARRNSALQNTETLRRLEAITNIPPHDNSTISVEEFERILEHSSIERIKEAIKAGADLHAPDTPYGETPMIFTIRRRPEPELIQLLLDSGVDVNEVGGKEGCYEGRTFLMVALTMPQNTYFRRSPYEVIKLLIDYGTNVNAKTHNGTTALIIAASNRDKDVVKLLLDSGANINAADNEGHTALMSASRRGSYELVDFLLLSGADVNAKDIDGRTALIEVLNNLDYTSVLKDTKIINLLLSSGAEVNISARDKGIWTRENGDCYRTPLMMAVNYCRTFHDVIDVYLEEVYPLPEIVKLLLTAGADVNAIGTDGKTALMLAVKVNEPEPEVIEMLLKAGADVNVECNGLRAVDFARRNKKLIGTETFRKLDCMTKPLGYKRHIGASEILELIRQDLADELRAVIADGADVNEREHEGGWTILMSAVRSDEVNLEIIDILLEAGANINATDEFDETALKKAVYNPYNETNMKLIKILAEAGADVDTVNDEGWTPLMEAAYHGNPDVVKLLVRLGADVNIERNGLRALDYAYGNELMTGTNALKELEILTPPRSPEHTVTDEEFIEICQIGAFEQIEKALKSGANVNARDTSGATMLMKAVDEHEKPNPELIRLFLHYGADVNVRNDRDSLLIRAAYNYRLDFDTFKLLLDSCTDIQSADTEQNTVLIAASYYNTPEVVRLLLERNTSNINAQDEFGRTALMYAVWHNNYPVVNILLDYGADVSLKDENGESAADYYLRSDHRHTGKEQILLRLQSNL